MGWGSGIFCRRVGRLSQELGRRLCRYRQTPRVALHLAQCMAAGTGSGQQGRNRQERQLGAFYSRLGALRYPCAPFRFEQEQEQRTTDSNKTGATTSRCVTHISTAVTTGVCVCSAACAARLSIANSYLATICNFRPALKKTCVRSHVHTPRSKPQPARLQSHCAHTPPPALCAVAPRLSAIYARLTGGQGDAYCSYPEDPIAAFVEGVTFTVR